MPAVAYCMYIPFDSPLFLFDNGKKREKIKLQCRNKSCSCVGEPKEYIGGTHTDRSLRSDKGDWMGPKKWLYIYVRDAGRFWCVGGLSSLARPAVLESWKKKGGEIGGVCVGGRRSFFGRELLSVQFPISCTWRPLNATHKRSINRISSALLSTIHVAVGHHHQKRAANRRRLST